MKNIFDIVKSDLIKLSKELNLEKEVIVEVNKNNFDAHFSTSIALMNAKDQKISPQILANKIKDILLNIPHYSSIEIAGPGFINLKVKPFFLSKVLNNVNTLKKDFGKNAKKNKIINIEYLSTNPTGFLHVGHARTAVVGSTLVNILKADGYELQTEYYVNDAGNQINVLAVTVFVHYLWLFNIEAKKPENSYSGTFYDDLALIMKEKYGDKFKNIGFEEAKILDVEAHEIFKKESVKYFLNQIKNQLTQIGASFDLFSSEKEMYKTNQIDLLLKELKNHNVTYEKDNALWLKSSEYGDDKDRVLVKTDGSYTYMVADLAMHNVRIKRSKADTLIDIFGGDHHGYIARMRAGLKLLGHDPNILQIELIQMVRVIKDNKEYKMSKRKGTAVWLIDIIKMIGKDALRYMLASKSNSSHMDLDIDLVQQKNASNPVYYAQYATARCHSIINQAKEKNVKPDFSETNILSNQKEVEMLLTIDSFNQVITSASKNRATQLICDFIYNLTKLFHSYYAENKIIDDNNMELSSTRLALVMIVLQTLSNAFDLIGISTLERM